MNTPTEAGTAQPRDRWIPWLFVAGFALVILVNGIMIYIALDSFSGLQTKGHYQRGLNYNETLAAKAAEQELGWSVAIDFTGTGANRGRITVEVADRAGKALENAAVRVRLVRPVQSGHDIDLKLAAHGEGLYAADLELPLRGQWDILALISHPSGKYSAAKRIVTQ